MKPIPRFLLIMVTLLSSTALVSQNLDPPTVKNNNSVVGQQDDAPGTSGPGSSAFQQNYLSLGKECGMYLCEEWQSGTIQLKDGSVFKDRMIRYNIYNQQMEYATGSDTAAIGNPEDLARLVIGDKSFVFRKFMCNNQVREGYLELLVKGEYELLLHRGIKYEYEEPGEGPGGPATRYYQANRYFLSCRGQVAEELPDSKREIIDIVAKDPKMLKKYVKENKCKLKSQDELVNFFVFVNNH